MSAKTYTPRESEIERAWYVVDATDETLGRIATRIARVLEGKHKPTYAAHLDTGDHVIVINAARITVTRDKLTSKVYARHSGYPAGFKEETLGHLLARRPEEVIRRAVKGMLPHNRLGTQMLRKLKVYAGASTRTRPRSPSRSPDRGALMSTPAFYWGTGRRKTAVARVRLIPGEGEMVVNGRTPEEHFGGVLAESELFLPFRVTGTEGRFNTMIKVEGGGITGQAGAIRHGIARALLQVDAETNRLPLRQAGLLTRDPRMKERKKYGLKRARKAPQYTKR